MPVDEFTLTRLILSTPFSKVKTVYWIHNHKLYTHTCAGMFVCVQAFVCRWERIKQVLKNKYRVKWLHIPNN